MSNWDDLLGKARKIAIEEGILSGTDGLTRELLPPVPRAKMGDDATARVINRILKEVGQGEKGREQPEIRTEEALPLISSTEPTPLSSAKEVDAPTERNVDPNAVVQEQLDLLESWVTDNVRLSRLDALRFWALKTPAIVSAASVSAFEAFGYGSVVIVLGVVAALCVSIDALFPGGLLYNVHKRASNEARRLQHNVITIWRQAQLDNKKSLSDAAHSILAIVQEERTRIDKYITDAEASLGQHDSGGGNKRST